MSQQTTGPRREFRAVEALTTGEHINYAPDFVTDVVTWQVGHAAAFTDANQVRMVALTLTPVGGGEPALVRERAGVTLPLSTDAEIADAVDAGRRFALAQALRALADDIVDRNLPVSSGWFSVGTGVLGSHDDLNRWAAYFSAEVTMGGPDKDIPVVNASRPVMDGLRLDFHAQSSAEVVLEPDDVVQGRFFTFGAGQRFDGRYVRIRGTYDSARAEMLARFGNAWSAQYDSLSPTRGFPLGLTELPESEWPSGGAGGGTE